MLAGPKNTTRPDSLLLPLSLQPALFPVKMSIGHKSPTDLRSIFRSSEHIFDSTQTPVIKTKCFARYYEDLAVPKDKGYETASLELRNVRHTLMEDICEEEAKTHTQVITSEMIQNAVESLNTGKAADEHGLKAEHFKNSPHAIYIFLEMCFKRILNDSITPDTFKTGILTPVLKKAKNPMIMDNYRGITVIPTSVHVPCKRNSY